jgi:uncharacterized protein (TIGR02217 family)
MSNFLEERVEYDDILIGATYTEEYNVEITTTSGGQEYRRLVHNLPRRSFVISYNMSQGDIWTKVLSLYHRCYGMYAGFRLKTRDDYTTNGYIGVPTATDQNLALVSAGVYQLQKAYGIGGATQLSIGLPTRTIYKPVTGTTEVAISNVPQTTYWSVDTTTGLVTFSANKTYAITSITKASSAVATIGTHTLVAGDSVLFSGVAGMTQINGLRGVVTAVGATTITVAIDSTLFSTYTSGGNVNTRPQAGEPVTAGCEFDIPCRFNSKVDILHTDFLYRGTSSIDVVELFTP